MRAMAQKYVKMNNDATFTACEGDYLWFEIPGKVRGKQRARIFQDVNSGKMRGRTPDETVNYENWVKMCFLKKYRQTAPTSEPLEVHIHSYFVRPKTNKKREPVTVKTDLDNICKSVLDALNGLVYADDRQVVRLHASKQWGDVEHVAVHIYTV